MRVDLRGTIMDNDGADIMRYFGYTDVCCPLDLSKAVRECNDGILDIYINSSGGDVISGSEMYAILKDCPHRTVAHIQSNSASAMTVAMMGCTHITASPAALICVHDPSTYASGTSDIFHRTAEELDNVKESIINTYMPRVKITRDEVSALMGKDIWIDVKKALEYGFIDEIEGGIHEENIENCKIVNVCGNSMFPSEKMISEYRKYIENKRSIMLEKARLELLKL